MVRFKHRVSFFLLLVVPALCPLWAQTITPTDVYRLAYNINRSLEKQYDVAADTFDKVSLSDSIKPRNVFQKVCFLHLEYNSLQPGFTTQAAIDTELNRDADTLTPADVYGLLDKIRVDLAQRGEYRDGNPTAGKKTPSDVFQMLRAVSHTIKTIGSRRGLQANWGPGRVFMLNYTQILPILTHLAETQNVTIPAFVFPEQAAEGITPRHIFAFQLTLYAEIASYYQTHKSYQPITFREFDAYDHLSPEDVFDLSLIILGELKVLHGSFHGDEAAFARWQAAVGPIKPGHVFFLLRHNFFLAVKTLRGEG